MRRVAGFLLLVGWACGGRETAAGFPLRKVAAAEIARLEAALPKGSSPGESPADLRDRVLGILESRAHARDKIRVLALKDAASIGEPAVPILDACIDEAERTAEEKVAALELLGAIDTEASSEALAKRVNLEKVRDVSLRRAAAWQLAGHSSDHVLPRILAQLKYEPDGETILGIAAVLAKHKNYAGVEGLRVLSTEGATPELRERAQAWFAEIAQQAGFQDPASLHAAWFGADAEGRIPAAAPSTRLRLEVWRCIANLGEFDLRLVDDARFALSRSAKWVAEELAKALHEEDAHVRLHTAQSLERMGPRATPACDELVAALAEPSLGPNAAAALGSIGCARAEPALIARLEPAHDPELRAAAAAALGRLGAQSAAAPLRKLLATSEPLDLRQAAAESLLALGEQDQALELLIQCLSTPGADPGAAESALESWLRLRSKSEPGASAVLTEWIDLGGSDVPHRQSSRGALLKRWLKDPSASKG